MKTLYACHSCDLLMEIETLDDNVAYCCPRCSHTITKWRRSTPERVIALSSAGMMFFCLATLFPFMTLSNQGLSHTMSLTGTTAHLFEIGYHFLAWVVILGIFVLPALMMLVALYLHLALYRQRRQPLLYFFAKYFFVLLPWSMIEVFLVGVLVSMIKILGLANLEFNTGFWAYLLFNILFTMMLMHVDQFRVWQGLEDVCEVRS